MRVKSAEKPPSSFSPSLQRGPSMRRLETACQDHRDISESNMRYSKKTLEESDFPLRAQHSDIMTSQDVPVAIALNKAIAQEIAARLNQDAWRRLEDMWSL